MEIIKEEQIIVLPNVCENLYRLVEKTNFWGKTTYVLWTDNRDHILDRRKGVWRDPLMLREYEGTIISLKQWDMIKDNISYLNSLKRYGISREVLNYIRTDSFKKIAKLLEFGIMDPDFDWRQESLVFDFSNSDKRAIVSNDGITFLSNRYGKIENQVKANPALFKVGVLKYWSLFLWKQYNNGMKTGFNEFRIIYEGRKYVGDICGPFHKWSAPNDYFWVWPEEFDLLHD